MCFVIIQSDKKDGMDPHGLNMEKKKSKIKINDQSFLATSAIPKCVTHYSHEFPSQKHS
jgi:hypothetical protein